jgi:hypothetical protein
MLNDVDDLIRKHGATGVLVDANMLLVYLVGLFNESYVELVKPNRGYTANDFRLVNLILSRFKTIIVTPSVLAEVSNLSSKLPEDTREDFRRLLAKILPTAAFTERLVELAVVPQAVAFIPFGFTDATIEQISAEGVPIFTDDWNLYQLLASKKADVFNYNHIRHLAM